MLGMLKCHLRPFFFPKKISTSLLSSCSSASVPRVDSEQDKPELQPRGLISGSHPAAPRGGTHRSHGWTPAWCRAGRSRAALGGSTRAPSRPRPCPCPCHGLTTAPQELPPPSVRPPLPTTSPSMPRASPTLRRPALEGRGAHWEL